MYKLLIVEDELILRTGLASYIDWHKYGFELIGEASNGLEAQNFIRENAVDVVITDIKMPVMSGLELVKWLKEQYAHVEVIIISGYDDFEFARQAIRSGVREYLLKPLNLQELYKTIERVSEELNRRSGMADELLRLTSLEEQTRRQREAAMLRQILSPEFNQALFEEQHPEAKDWMGKYYYAFFMICDTAFWRKAGEYDYMELLAADQKLQRVLEDFLGEEELIFKENLGERLVMIRNENRELLGEKSKAFCRQMEELTTSETYEILGRQIVKGSTALWQSYQMAHSQWKERLTEYWSIQPFAGHNERQPFNGMLRYDSSAILQAIRVGDIEGIEHGLQVFEKDLLEQKIESYLQWLMVFCNLFNDVISLPLEIGRDCSEGIGSPNDCLTRLLSMRKRSEILKAFLHVCQQIAQQFQLYGGGRQQNILAQALQFIEKNYAQPDLMLNDVARAVFISASYLSLTLKKELGKTFTEVLTEVRMKKAQALLTSTELKSYEIAFLCGYANPSYFSTVFKSYYQCSPSQLKAKLEQSSS